MFCTMAMIYLNVLYVYFYESRVSCPVQINKLWAVLGMYRLFGLVYVSLFVKICVEMGWCCSFVLQLQPM